MQQLTVIKRQSVRRVIVFLAGGTLSAIPRSLLMVTIASVIQTSSTAAQQPRQITLTTPDRVSPAEYNRISSIRELADGSILISDRNDNRLIHLEWSGGAPELIGRVGSGPGEYHTAGRLVALGGDSTLFIDVYTGRWLLLNGAQIVGTVSEHHRLNQLFGSYVLGADTLGHVLGYVGVHYSNRRLRIRGVADSVAFLLGERATETADTIALAAGRGSAGYMMAPPSGGKPGRIIVSNPLATEDQALLFIDGWVALAYVEPYRVDWRAPDGHWVRGAPIHNARIEASDREKCASIGRMLATAVVECEPSDFPGWPEFVPPFGPRQAGNLLPSLLAAPNGTLVIARTPLVTYSGRGYDVINRSGARVAVIKLPESQAIVGFGARSVYVLVTNDDGLQQIRRYRWKM